MLLSLQNVATSASPSPEQKLVAPAESQNRGRKTLVPEKKSTLGFSVDTNVGLVSGTIPVVQWVSRGLDGRGRFQFEVELDGQGVETGDAFTDRFIRENILPKRLLASGSGLIFRAGEGGEPGRFAIKTWIVIDKGAPKYREVYFSFEAKEDGGGFFSAQHEISFDALGLPKIPHPFVNTKGKITLELTARLVPETR